MTNEQFRNQYPEGELERDYYVSKMEDVLDEFGVPATSYGVIKNVEMWQKNKPQIINILRNHPNWNEEAKAIVFTETFKRTSSSAQSCADLRRLIKYVREKITALGFYHQTSKTLNFLSNMAWSLTPVVSERFVEELPDSDLLKKPRVGQKMTRYIQSLFKSVDVYNNNWGEPPAGKIDATAFVDEHEEGNREYCSYDKLFAILADGLSPMEIKKVTVLSANPIDYLLMSYGNSWHSCHLIGASEGWEAGTLSYMNDSSTMIYYTLPSTYDEDEWSMQRKMTRQVFSYKDGLLMQSRLYPSSADEEYDQNRLIVQHILSDCLGLPNLWLKRSLKDGGARKYLATHSRALHYEDYFQDYAIVSTLNAVIKKDEEAVEHLIIGEEAFCSECGYTLSDANSLSCCTTNKECYQCGNSRDDMHEINGEYYCDNCSFYCQYHEEYEREKDFHIYVEGYGSICSDAYEEDFSTCEGCEEVHRSRDMYVIDDCCYCWDCINDVATQCSECGELCLNDDLFCNDDGRDLCKDCESARIEEEVNTDGGEESQVA